MKYKIFNFIFAVYENVQQDISRQVNFGIKATICEYCLLFSKICFDERIA